MKRVAIIDDDDIFIFLCSRALENLGFTEDINKFNDSKKGLEYLISLQADESTFPTMLLVDINMPALNGWDIVETLEKIDSEVVQKCKVFILSSSLDGRDKEKALNFKMVTDFLMKPVTEAQLRLIAAEHFGLS